MGRTGVPAASQVDASPDSRVQSQEATFPSISFTHYEDEVASCLIHSWLPPWLEAGLFKGPNANLPEKICCSLTTGDQRCTSAWPKATNSLRTDPAQPVRKASPVFSITAQPQSLLIGWGRSISHVDQSFLSGIWNWGKTSSLLQSVTRKDR